MKGTVVKGIGGFYFVYDGNSVVMGKARGNLKRNRDLIYVGDIVDFDIDKSEYMGLDTAFTTPLNESPIIIQPDTIVRSFDYVCEYVFDLVSRFTMEYGAPTKGTIEGDLSLNDIREFFTENDYSWGNDEKLEFIWVKNGTALMVSTYSTTFPEDKYSNYRYTPIHIRVGLVNTESEFEIFLNSKSRLVSFNGYEIKRTVLDWLIDTDLLDTANAYIAINSRKGTACICGFT